MKITIDRVRIRLDPSVDVFPIEVDYDDGSVWNETFATEAELDAFLRGIRAGSRVLVPLAEIPRRPTHILSQGSNVEC